MENMNTNPENDKQQPPATPARAITTLKQFKREFVSISELSEICLVEESRVRQLCREHKIGFVVGTVRIISRDLIPRVQDACLRSRKRLQKKLQKKLERELKKSS